MIVHSSVKHRNFGLDMVRSTAISLVFIAHFTPWDFLSIPAGFIGVEVFFVLSGYLIGGILLRDASGPEGTSPSIALRFCIRRWFRTLPNYFVYLLFFYALNPLFMASNYYWLQYTFFLQNLAWPHPGYFHVAWSLAIEEWMYIVLPTLAMMLTLLARYRLGKTSWPLKLPPVAITAGGVVMMCAIWRGIIPPQTSFDEGIRKVALLRLDAIAVGVVLASLKCLRPSYWLALTKSTAVGAIIIICSAALIALESHAGTLDLMVGIPGVIKKLFLFPCIGVGAALLLARATVVTTRSASVIAATRSISNLSYSLYLAHWLVITFTLQQWPRHDGTYALTALETIVAIPASGLLAWITYSFIEKPFLRMRDRWFPPSARFNSAPDDAFARVP